MAEIDMSVFSGRMREARKNRGVGKTEAAKMIGVGKTVIRYWENGNRTPTACSLCLICKAYDVSADWLLGIMKDCEVEYERL